MSDVWGVLALGISLAAMAQVNMLRLRWLHICSSALYVVYGFTISAFPIVFGGITYCLIHLYRIRKQYLNIKNKTHEDIEK
ncbi:MAG: hypothetical protein AAGL34_11660 [Bacteroidota bacterium]